MIVEISLSILVYAGLIAAFLGFLSLLWPLRFLRIRSRTRGAIVFVSGIAAVLIAFNLPARETRVPTVESQLDRFMPAYQFHEFHSIRVHASREKVFQAIKEVRANEIFLFRTLTWIRRFGRPGPESLLNAPQEKPILDVALRSGFILLTEEPGREIVLGAVVAAPPGWRLRDRPAPDAFRAFRTPGFALAAMNFRLDDAGAGETLLTTETRVYATDASARRRFAPYWRTIYPGSALIRVMWLRAVRRRAEM
jgi:hypothetical protein